MTDNIDELKSKMSQYEAQLNYPDALRVLSELLKAGCQDADVMYSGARYSFEMRNYELADRFLENALSIEPSHTDARLLKGRILLTHNATLDALAVFDSILTHCQPDDAQKQELRQALAVFIKYNADVLRNHFPALFKFMSSETPSQSVKVQAKGHLKIGLYLMWSKGSLTRKQGNVLGDELIAESLCRVLRQMPAVAEAELYAQNYLPKEKLDIMIYFNITPPVPDWADKHVLYMQNGYTKNCLSSSGSLNMMKYFHTLGYDAYMFISKGLLELHRQSNPKPALFLPFGADTSVFYPRARDDRFKCEVAYIGNDIKGKERTTDFILPALDFDFALYGNWQIPFTNEVWKNYPYQLYFAQKSRGKIPQEDVPTLYSTAQINLNCTLQDCIDWDVITLRTFEILACKGFVISDGSPAVIKELSDCVVFTEGGYDLQEKIRYYLAHPEERAAYAERGYNYVLKHATVEARASKLMEFLLTI